MVRSAGLAVLVSTVLIGTGCATGDGRQLAPALEPPPPPPSTAAPSTTVPTLDLLAPWPAGGDVTNGYGCGTGVAAPALTWSAIDLFPVEYLLTIAVDGVVQDALVGIPADVTGLNEGQLPVGAFWWPPTDVGRRWPGVCGPEGATTTFTLYALNQQLEVADDAGVAEVTSHAELTAIAHDIVTGVAPPPATTPTS